MRQTGTLSLVAVLSACHAPDVVIGARGERPVMATAGAVSAERLDASLSEAATETGKVAVNGSDAGSHGLKRRKADPEKNPCPAAPNMSRLSLPRSEGSRTR